MTELVNNTFKFANGNKFEGHCKIKLNKGIMTYKNGDVYTGSFDEEARKTGFGKLVCNNGTIFEGMFTKNSYAGKGKITLKNGTTILHYATLNSLRNIIIISNNDKNSTTLQFLYKQDICKEYVLPETFKNFSDFSKFLHPTY